MLDKVHPDDADPKFPFMTAEEFAAKRLDFPEGGRWFELHAGQPTLLQAPDDAHGNVVLNLSRQLATWFQSQQPGSATYAGYDLGLHVSKEPDTVYFAAICCFNSGPLFSQNDLLIADQVPHLVVDIASSNDRRRDMRLRTMAYMKLGVEVIWIPDPFKNEIQVLRRDQPTLALGPSQSLEGGAALPGFSMPVRQVFAQPAWWSGQRKPE